MDTNTLMKLGAKARLAEIDMERGELLRILGGRPTPGKPAPKAGDKRRKPMSAAKRKALSEKLKAWHAAHPKKAGGKK